MGNPHNNPQDQIEVTPNLTQSREDIEANHAFDEARDNELQDEHSN